MVVPNSFADAKTAEPQPRGTPSPLEGLTIRAREPSDFEEIAALMNLPKVRWGTLRLPFTTKEQWRKMSEAPPDGMTCIVAELDETIVGIASITQYKGRRSHVGGIGMSAHDEFCGRGIGSALLAALIDLSDNWLNLKRLELTVYIDNEPAIRLYQKFGFEVEGTHRRDVFRGGKYVDSFFMAQLRPGWSTQQ
jgi:L-phenylalanine/L-methionine N-acetyltransferase